MVDDEPALWATIPDRLKPNVEVAAEAMCRHRSEGDEFEDDCTCHLKGGGSCIAFGLYGDLALDAVKAIDELQLRRIASGLGLRTTI